MKLLIDGVCFQIYRPFLASLWTSLLPRLAARTDVDLFILDRGGMPPIEGAISIVFPPHKFLYTPDESVLIQTVCDHYGIDVFLSTHFTSALATPAVLILNDLIPERHAFSAGDRRWTEREIGIGFARALILASNGPLGGDLARLYPEIPAAQTRAVDLFRRDAAPIPETERQTMLVCVEDQDDDDLFRAVAALGADELGGRTVERIGDPAILRASGPAAPPYVSDDLGAGIAQVGRMLDRSAVLVCLKPIEGYELASVAALMRGCRVIGCADPAVAHLDGNGFHRLDEVTVESVKAAIRDMREALPMSQIAWNAAALAEAITAAAADVAGHHQAGDYDDFFRRWRRLRELQSCVDEGTMY